MSKYYVNKFLFTVDRDPDWVARYKEDPVATIEQWEKEIGGWLNSTEKTTWLSFTDEERRALASYDYVWLFEYGAHFFLYLTLFIGLFEDNYTQAKGPLSYQKEWAKNLSHWSGKNYPSVAS